MAEKFVVVTGGLGFIGSNFLNYLATHRPSWRIVNIDAFTYAANPASLKENPKLEVVKGDIADSAFLQSLFDGFDTLPDLVINFAAESHVDRSIHNPIHCINANYMGVFNLLELFRMNETLRENARFVQISTDEVYGALHVGDAAFTERTPLAAGNPYSSAKAAADLLGLAYHNTYEIDLVITRCSNNYGPYQFPEKLIPFMTLNALNEKPLPVYGDGKNIRDWIHVADHCRGVLMAAEKAKTGEIYNFGGDSERANIDIVSHINQTVRPEKNLISFVKDRPGHDFRYAMNFDKAKTDFGWMPEIPFEQGLTETIQWYLDNEAWWKPILSGEYLEFFKTWYEER